MNYANLFAPVTVGITAMLVPVLPIALGLFATVLGIRLGARLISSFIDGDSADEDEDDA